MLILLAEFERHKHEGFEVRIKVIDTENGDYRVEHVFMRDEMVTASAENMALALAMYIVNLKPDKIIFDKTSASIVVREALFKVVSEGWLTFIMDSTGNIIYKKKGEN